jgi:hypothetical protein
LRVFWRFCFPALFLVVPFRVEHGSHAQELQVTLQLRREICSGEVEPLRTGGGLFFTLCRLDTHQQRTT